MICTMSMYSVTPISKLFNIGCYPSLLSINTYIAYFITTLTTNKFKKKIYDNHASKVTVSHDKSNFHLKK